MYTMQSRKIYFVILVPLLLVVLALFYIARYRQEGKKDAVNVHGSQSSSTQNKKASTEKPPEKHTKSEEKDYILHPENLCMRGTSRVHLDYLLLIHSAPRNFDKRNAIRETWGTELKELSNSRVAFLLAKVEDASIQRAIESESYLHSDIIQATYVDHYQNQSLKAKMMIKWAFQYCPQVSFLLKSDDDSFMNVPKFLKVMKNKRTDAIYGALFVNAKPSRETFSKWYVSLEHYNGTEYPLFVGGAFYALGGRTVQRLCEASEQVPFFWLEDVFLTGFVAQKAGVTRIHEDSITTYAAISVCSAMRTSTSHHISARNMRLYWYRLHYSQLRC